MKGGMMDFVEGERIKSNIFVLSVDWVQTI